jgi:hypothetical protein
LPLSSGNRWRTVASSGNKWHLVTSSGNKWHPVMSSGNKWRPVTSSGNRCPFWWQCDHISVCAYEAEITLTYRASNRILGRRIKGGELLPSWDPPFPFSGGPEPPPVFVIVSDIRDSEIQDRKRVLYSYSYLRRSYGIEPDLTTQSNARRW